MNSDVFTTLGVAPAAGRAFTAEDDRVGGANVVLVSHGLAMGLFGAAANAVGQNVSLDNQAHTIVGVMPASFAFPSRNTQLWRPLRFPPALLSLRSNHLLYVVAWLRPGVSMDQARADMDVVAGQLQRAYPKDNARSGIAVIEMRDMMPHQSRALVLAVFGAAFRLLLIACTNLASLLFARAMGRRQEIAVRMAVDAARERLFRQLLTESLLLAALGGGLGLLAAAITTPLLARLVPAALPMAATPQMDWRVFGFRCDPHAGHEHRLRHRTGPAIRTHNRSGCLARALALLAVLMTVAGSLRPAMRAAATNPALTIRTE